MEIKREIRTNGNLPNIGNEEGMIVVVGIEIVIEIVIKIVVKISVDIPRILL